VDGCVAKAERVWSAGGADYAVRIETIGATCEAATAKLTVTAPEGVVVHTDELIAAQTFALNAAKTPAEMQAALAEVIGDPMTDTSNLPAWEAGAEQPGGEFPFYPEMQTDRAAYEKLRAAKTPMLCYVQGGESTGCWLLDGAKLVKVGSQTFPG
jgi:ribosomal protein L12E/L44/L45/RPP1/RPP2